MSTILETERLLLRRLEPEDLDDLFALYCDPGIRQYFPEGTLTLAETKDELDWFTGGGDPQHPELGLWATIHKASGKFIGRCGLIPSRIDGRLEIEVAYLLAKDFWRQGLGGEMARALVRYGFEQLNLTRLIALIDADNIASKRTAMKAGLSFEQSIVHEGTICEVYAIGRAAIGVS